MSVILPGKPDKRERDVVALCTVCWTECEYEEELTIGWSGPRQCHRCGKVCKKQSADFHVVWYPPKQAQKPVKMSLCRYCGEGQYDDGTERHIPLCAAVTELRDRVDALESALRLKR